MDFECSEIVYSVIKYTPEAYSSINIQSEIKEWKETLENDSYAKPVLVGSPFDDDDGHMDLSINTGEELDANTVYVVIYYFYESANYRISDDVTRKWTVNCDSVLANLNISCAMESASLKKRVEDFECDSSTDKTSVKISIHRGNDMILEGEVDDLFTN